MFRRADFARSIIVSAARRRAALRAGVSLVTLLTVTSGAMAANLGGTQLPSPGMAAPMMPGAQEAARAASNVENALRRATIAIQAMQSVQQAARDAARVAPSTVPNGLRPGGLQLAPGVVAGSALWQGAKLPTETVNGGQTRVTVEQTQQKAILNWQSFNVGRETELYFNQSAGGANANQWSVLNRVLDPSVSPSRILGSIKAEGQVYVINPNGIIFSGASQINVGTLVASSLSLSNAQFLAGINKQVKIFDDSSMNSVMVAPQFGYLGQEKPNIYVPLDDPTQVAGVTIGEAPKPVMVEAGAQINIASGGKAMLFAPQVINAGRIRAPDGQVLIAAGEQIYLLTDPTIRGLDVAASAPMRWVFPEDTLSSALGSLPASGFAGGIQRIVLPEMAARAASVGYRIVNNGIVEADHGNITLVGREVIQNGGLHAATALNNRDGSIRLRAWEQGQPAFGSTYSGPPLHAWGPGTLVLGSGSVTTAMPDIGDPTEIEQAALATRYRPGRVELRGKLIDIEAQASVIVPAGTISVVASTNPLSGEEPISGEPTVRDGSRVYLGEEAFLSVAGVRDVAIAMERNIISGEFRINELRDSPLYRDSWLRGMKVSVDKRASGVFASGPMAGVKWVDGAPGKWVGTPLGDFSGWIGVGKTDLGELSTRAGSIVIKSSGSVIMRPGSLLDVSGGSVRYRDGWITTTQLLGIDGRVYDIGDAMPDRVYVGLAGGFVRHHARAGITEIWTMPGRTGTRFEKGYTEGRDAGTVQFYAAEAMVLEGSYYGGIINGERQIVAGKSARAGALIIGSNSDPARSWLPGQVIVTDTPTLLPDDFTATSTLDTMWYDGSDPTPHRAKTTYLDPAVLAASGMAKFDIYVAKGFALGRGQRLELAPQTDFSMIANVGGQSKAYFTVDGEIRIAGGNVGLIGGINTFGEGARIDVSGQWVNSLKMFDATTQPVPVISGGRIRTSGAFASGVVLDVSGGGSLDARTGKAKLSFGDAGAIELGLSNGAELAKLDLRGFSAASGGELTVRTDVDVQIGGTPPADPSTLHLPGTVFSDRGFREVSVRTTGGILVAPGSRVTQIPVSILPSTDLSSVASGAPIWKLGTLGLPSLADRLRHKPASLSIAGTDVLVDKGAVLQTDATGSIALSATGLGPGDRPVTGNVKVSGTLVAPAGAIVLGASSGDVIIEAGAELNARGVAAIDLNARGWRVGRVLDGGTINIKGHNVALDAGALLDVSGASGEIDVYAGLAGGSAFGAYRLDSNGGSIVITGETGEIGATLRAAPGGPRAIGGTLAINIEPGGAERPRTVLQSSLGSLDPDCFGFAGNGVCDNDWRDVIGFDIGRILASLGYEVDGAMVISQDLYGYLPTGTNNIVLASSGSGGQKAVDLRSHGWTDAGLDLLRDVISLDLRALFDPAAMPKALVVRPTAIASGGFANLALQTTGAVKLDGVDIALARSITIKGALIGGSAAGSTLRAPYISLSDAEVVSAERAGRLTLSASLIDIGQSYIMGFDETVLQATDIRLNGVRDLPARLDTDGRLTLQAGQVYPSSRTRAFITSREKITVVQNGASVLPLSATGELILEAPDIEQRGTLRAPFGSITLKASHAVVLGAGSLTSVSGDGLVVPLGALSNGENWTLPDGNDLPVVIAKLPEKRIVLDGPSVNMAQGSVVDVRGGGDLYAWEHVPGPGGSRDLLAGPNVFAIVPGLGRVASPLDATLNPGDGIWLAGVWYPLLPARFALLPGAFAVTRLPGSESADRMTPVTMLDGSVLINGTAGNAFGGQDQLGAVWRLMPGNVIRRYSEYNEAFANRFFASDAFKLTQYRLTGEHVLTPRLPMDGGSLLVKATQDLVLDGTMRSQAAAGGRGGLMDIAAGKIAIVGAGQNAAALRADGYLVIGATALSNFGAGSLLIGGTRSSSAKGMRVEVSATSVVVRNDDDSRLVGPDIILAASGTLEIGAGSVVTAVGEAAGDSSDLIMLPQARARYGDANGIDDGNPNNDVLLSPPTDYGALVRVSNGLPAGVRRENVDSATGGKIVIGAGARLGGGRSLLVDSTGNAVVATGAELSGASMSLASGRIGLGGGSDGLVLDAASLAQLSRTQHLTLRSYSSIDFHTSISFGGAGLSAVTLDAGALVGRSGAPVTIAGDVITLQNSGGNFAVTTAAGGGTLMLSANELVLGGGSKAIRGFGAITLGGNLRVVGQGSGSIDAGDAAVTIATPVLTGRGGSSQSIVTAGVLAVRGGGAGMPDDPGQSLGSRIALTGRSVAVDGRIVGRGGAIEITATNGDVRLADGALIDVGGFAKQFFDLALYADAGRISLTAVGGDVRQATSAVLNLAADPGGGNAGRLAVTAAGGGTVVLDGHIAAAAGHGKGGSFALDIAELPAFAALNQRLNEAGFFTSRQFRIRNGDVLLDGVTTVADFGLSADRGRVTVAGTVDATAPYGGRILISGGNGLAMTGTAQLKAGATDVLGGGRVILEATGGRLDLSGGTIDVAGGAGGRVRLRARQSAGHDDVAVDHLQARIVGARDAVLEAVSVYAGQTSVDQVRALAVSDALTFASQAAAVAARLDAGGIAVMPGIEIQSSGDLTLASDWNLFGDFSGTRLGGLTLRAAGNLMVNGHLSDGFDRADRSGQLQDAASWDLRLVAGADLTSASVLAVRPLAELAAGAGSLVVGSGTGGKVIRTGSGDIDARAGRDISLAHNESVIYTAGRKDATIFADFTTAPVAAVYGVTGGHLRLSAQGNISSALPANLHDSQLFTEWLKRSGRLDAEMLFTEQSTWWVDYGAFQNGVGVLGGGNVAIDAGGDLVNLLVAMPTNARVRGGRTAGERMILEMRNGGLMSVDAGGAIRAGYYYAGRGAAEISAGEMAIGRTVTITGPVNDMPVMSGPGAYGIAPVLALGDATMSVRTAGDLRLQTVLDPLLLATGNIHEGAYIGGYTDRTALTLTSIGGDVALVNQAQFLSKDLDFTDVYHGPDNPYAHLSEYAGNLYPSMTRVIAFNGAVRNLWRFVTMPGATPELSMFAERDVVPGIVVMSRATRAMLPSAFLPMGNGNGDPISLAKAIGISQDFQSRGFQTILLNELSPDPIYGGYGRYVMTVNNPDQLANTQDTTPSRFYARTGSIANVDDRSFTSYPVTAKIITNEQAWFRAGTDIRNIRYQLRNMNRTDVSVLEAGNDIIGGAGVGGGTITIEGPGALVLSAGRDVYSSTLQLYSTGNRRYDDNNRPMLGTEIHGLPADGAAISVLAGLRGRQPAYDAFVAAYLDPANVAAMPAYLRATVGSQEVPLHLTDAFDVQPDGQLHRTRAGLVSFIKDITGETLAPLDAFARFRTLPLFTQQRFLRQAYMMELREAGEDQSTPGPNGLPRNGGYNRGYAAIATLFPGQDWKGDVTSDNALMRTMAGGNIEVLTPGGGLQVAALRSFAPAGFGLVALGTGEINVFAHNSVTVNRSRVLTFGGGDLTIWSTVGDIDAGRGAKTVRVPSAPEVSTDDDAVTKVRERADISGSGMGTIIGFAGVKPGDVHLIAPEGTVNPNDGGLRVSGNLTIAARFVINTDNISVGGVTKGVPPKESAVTMPLLDTGSKDKAANDAAKDALPQGGREKASIIMVEVLGYGGASPEPENEEERRRRQSEGGVQDPTNRVQVLDAGDMTAAQRRALVDERRRLVEQQ